MRGDFKRNLIIGASCALFLLCLVLGRKLSLDEDITALVPDNDPLVSSYRLVLDRFKMLDSIFIDVGTDSNSPEARKQVIAAADILFEKLSSSGAFTRIHYRTSIDQLLDLLDMLSVRKPYLLNGADLSALETQLTPQHIRRQLEAARRMLIEPSGSFMLHRLRRDPLGFDERLLKKLAGLEIGGDTVQMADGRIWSTDSRHVLLVASPRSPAVDTRAGAQLVSSLRTMREDVAQSFDGSIQIGYTGGHFAALDNAEATKKDVSRAVTATSAGIVLCGLLFFRRKSALLFIFMPTAFGIACAAALYALFDPLISGIAVGCAVVLIGITVDYGIHILYHLDSRQSVDPHAGVRSLLLPLLLGAGTTAGAFLCLRISAIPGQRQMGLFATVGDLFSVLFAILVLPYWISKFGKNPGARKALPLTEYVESFLNWNARHSRLLMALLGVATVAGVLGLSALRFDGDIRNMNYLREDNRRDEGRLLEVWGDFSGNSVAVSGKTLEEALVRNDRICEALDSMAGQGKVSSFLSISRILPSAETQEENWRRWENFWSARRETLHGNIADAASGLKFASNAFDPFYDLLDQRPDLLSVADYDGTGLDKFLQTYVSQKNDDCYVLSTFVPAAASAAPEIASHLKAVVPDAIVLDNDYFVQRMSVLALRELKKLSIAVFIVMTLFLIFSLRRIELVMVILLPTFLTVALTLGILGACGIPINLISTLFIVFIFGVGIDYSIFLLTSALDTHRGLAAHEKETCGAVTLGALTSSFAFAALAFAEHPVLFSIGITGFVGILTSMVTAIVTVPAVTRLLLAQEDRDGTPSLKTMAGALFAFVYLAGLCSLYVFFLRYIAWIRHRGDIEARRRFARRCIRLIASGLLRCFPYRHSERIFIDADPEKFHKPAIIISNHLSRFDIIVILALPVEMVMVVKDWVWKTPVMGRFVRDAGYLLVDGSSPEVLLQRCADLLRQGVSVMLFPEGTRSPDGKMHRFHKGAFELAIRTRADIIPVLLTDTQACIPRKSFWIGDHCCVIRALPRIAVDSQMYVADSRQLARNVKDAMLAFEHADWERSQTGKAFWHNIRSLYNYQGAYVESYIGWKLRLDPIFACISDLIPLEGTILDLGCGYGLTAGILARKSRRRRVIGADIDERKVRVARRVGWRMQNVAFELQDIIAWDYPASDGVVMVDVLHYWPEETQQAIIRKACACLSGGGTLLFREACAADGLGHLLTAWAERFSTRSGHNRAGKGLYFASRDFYVHAFERENMKLQSEPFGAGLGSNKTMVWRKN